jgi:hypothetical protein
MQTTTTTLNHRDRAVLRAVAAGRCEIPAGSGGTLVVDGLCFADQFAGLRLTAAGLIAAGVGRARLTASGQAMLAAA